MIVILVATGDTFSQSRTPLCLPRHAMRDLLLHKYFESPVVRMLREDGVMIEIFSTHDGKTWSEVWTRTNMHSCLFQVGEAFIKLDPVFMKEIGDKM